MPTSRQTSANDSTADAIALLTSDHEEVKEMFDTYADLVDAEADSDERRALAEEICMALTVHATIEEEIFYPAARDALEEQDLLDEAEVEHASAKDLIAQIMDMDADDELFDAKVTVLGEYIAHHVKEEEDEMFPKVRDAELDLEALGEQMDVRKEELTAELAADARTDA
jgi:hemerythrin superfamily protein